MFTWRKMRWDFGALNCSLMHDLADLVDLVDLYICTSGSRSGGEGRIRKRMRGRLYIESNQKQATKGA